MSISRINRKFFLMAVNGALVGKDTENDIAVRCPICGDSQKKKNSTRLHLYSKGGYEGVSCFNGDCPAHNKTMYGFLKDFFPALLQNYKKENFGSTMENLAKGDRDVFSKFKNREKTQQKEQTREVLVHDLSAYLKCIREVPEALTYLESRGLPYNEKFGKWYFGFQNLKIGEVLYPITDAVVIPLYYQNEMYGFYSRSIKDKSFYTYMNDANIGYKIWNWFNIDKNEPVYIYEGIFDCIAGGFKNSIALLGAKLPEQRLKELKNPVFVLDNDKTGLYNSLQYAKRGCSVYIQPDQYPEKDMNELMLSGVNTTSTIQQNLFSGIAAEVRIKGKL